MLRVWVCGFGSRGLGAEGRSRSGSRACVLLDFFSEWLWVVGGRDFSFA